MWRRKSGDFAIQDVAYPLYAVLPPPARSDVSFCTGIRRAEQRVHKRSELLAAIDFGELAYFDGQIAVVQVIPSGKVECPECPLSAPLDPRKST